MMRLTRTSIPHLLPSPMLLPNWTSSGPISPNSPYLFPSIVINSDLVNELGLRRYPLPPREDNLSTLSEPALSCREYVKLELSSGNGGWKSMVFRAKVNVGLPVSLILGMPFLSSQHIVIDSNARTAKDKRTGYELRHPEIPTRKWAPERVVPPPMDPCRQKNVNRVP